MKKEKMNLRDIDQVSESIARMFIESEAYAKGYSDDKKVSGWLEPSENIVNGEGCLITFAYINTENGELKFYAMSDTDILQLLYFIYVLLESSTITMDVVLYAAAATRLINENKDVDSFHLEEWEITYLVKSYYEKMTDQDYDLSHLNFTDQFNLEGLNADMDEMRMRGINLAQLIAEECLVFFEKEKRAA